MLLARTTLPLLLLSVGVLFLGACSSTGTKSNDTKASDKKMVRVISTKRGGGFYQDDGPGDNTPENLDSIPNAVPRLEPLSKAAMKPYTALGQQYTPYTELRSYRATGIASWYGRKYHGQKTSIGEIYDMYAMTAAHTILPLPSYVRVTNKQNGQSVIVRLNDRGPFLAGREIDLSYVAAHKLGLLENGSGEVEVEAIIPNGALSSDTSVSYPNNPSNTSIAVISTRRVITPLAPSSPLPPVITPTASVPAVTAITPPAPLLVSPMNSSPTFAAATSSNTGVFLQLGAFSSVENAEALKSRLSQGKESEWLKPIQVYAAAGLHRVQVGPYADREQAQKVAERVRDTLGYAPNIITR